MIEIPDWLDKKAWNDFVAFRKEIKARMTDRAQELAIKKLDTWRQKGHDPTDIINASIMNSWRGLFEPKSNVNGKSAKFNCVTESIERLKRSGEMAGYFEYEILDDVQGQTYEHNPNT